MKNADKKRNRNKQVKSRFEIRGGQKGKDKKYRPKVWENGE